MFWHDPAAAISTATSSVMKTAGLDLPDTASSCDLLLLAFILAGGQGLADLGPNPFHLGRTCGKWDTPADVSDGGW
ncbi:hypothetical protein [Xylella fastidiosa]|uniref:hypothetical protein n=1 Tax=Xylella fastidiosa TaxID=2371 RepID=UPI00191014C0|nr:hypothetical protein [Xylella fastidiosa]WNY20320.1 hypothetical protein RO839_11870 [Xylella fastidiosa]WNY22611.1 hypothetical protein RO838_11865 [Xylella fastidiosa]